MRPAAGLAFLGRLLGVLGLFCTAAYAGESAAFSRLEKTPIFAFGGIGFAGTTSEGEIAFHAIFTSASAESDCLRLLKTGNAQAKCYALVGLRLKDRARFSEQVKPLISSKEEVQTCAGCTMMKQRISSILASIQRGNYNEEAMAKPRPR